MKNNYRMRTAVARRDGTQYRASRVTTLTTLVATVCVGVCLIGLITSVQSGPVYERNRRMTANGEDAAPVISSSNGKARNETSPNKDVCLMEGHTIPRRLVSCPTKPGCRAIQKEGECCPEYQCECERNGKLYENGEKIMDPETPCRVCYCQGGEFTCNNVTCYNRNDCKPKYTPGRCCPEYDNCPPLDTNKSDHNDNNSSDNTDEEHDKPTTASAEVTTGPGISSVGSSIPPSAVGNDNPLGIKIKEITKPEEIRITDEKPKFKVSTSTSTTTTTTTEPSPTYPFSTSEPTEATFEAVSTSESATAFDQSFNKTTDDPFQLGEEFEQDLFNGSDTNKNVREVDSGFINGLDVGAEEAYKEPQVEDVGPALEIGDQDSRSLFASSSTTSTTTETPQQPQEDVKQVIVLDNFGEAKPINVVGTSELQFGGGSPDEDINTYDFLASSSSSSSSFSSLGSSTPMYIDPDGGSGAGEGHTEKSISSSTTSASTTDAAEGSATTSPPQSEETFTEASLSSLSPSAVPESEEVESSSEETTFGLMSSSAAPPSRIQSHQVSVTESAPLENEDLTNPEYPKLPEDLSQHQEEHAGNYAGNYADAEERSPGEPHLVPEWERNNATGKDTIQEQEEGKTSDEETNSVFNNYGDEKSSPSPSGSPSAAEQTTEGHWLYHSYGGANLDGDMMSENATKGEGEDEGRISPSPKDDVESLKMMSGGGDVGVLRRRISEQEKGLAMDEEEEEQDEGGKSERGPIMGRYLSGEKSFWDLI